MHPVSGHECSAATHVCLSFVQVAAESDEIQSFYSLLFLIVIATQIISLNPLWLKFGDLWFFISFVMTKYLRSLVMGAVGGWGPGVGDLLYQLFDLVSLLWKKGEKKTPTHVLLSIQLSHKLLAFKLSTPWNLHVFFLFSLGRNPT